MSQFFYTAIFRPTTGEILREDNFLAAEHFADEVERNKRAKQFETHARSLGEIDPWMVYSGDEPLEAYLVKVNEPLKPDEEVPAGSPEEAYNASLAKYTARVDKIAAEAAKRTVSILTAPEVDDSQEARELPAWAIAQHAVEAAELAVRDAQDGVDAAQKRADQIIARVFSTAPDRPAAVAEHAEWEKKTLIAGAPGADARVSYDDRRQAVAAQTEVDHQKARLYRAEEELKARQAELGPLMATMQRDALQAEKDSAKEAQRHA